MIPHKILFITTNSELAGGEMAMVCLAAGLDTNHFRPVVICPGEGTLRHELVTRGIMVHTMKVEGFGSYAGIVPRFPLKTILQLLSFVRREEIDLIHAHHYEALKLSGLVATIAGVPSIWTCHGFWYSLKGVKGIFINAVVDRVVAVSEFVKRYLASQGTMDSRKLSLIYNSVAPEFWEEEFDPVSVRQEFGISSDAFLVGVVGRIDPGKGHEDFLVAFKEVVAQKPLAKALLVGKSFDLTYRGQLESLIARLGISQQVIFTGFRRDMTKIYDALDLLVLPSKGEAFPLVLIEAMARRKPIVATDCGGPSEALGDNQYGLLVSPGNPFELTQGILRMINDDELRHRLAEAGHCRAKRDFMIEKMVQQNERIYLELLNGRG